MRLQPTLEEQILHYMKRLGRKVQAQDVMRGVKISASESYTLLARLVNQGMASRTAYGTYELTAFGKRMQAWLAKRPKR